MDTRQVPINMYQSVERLTVVTPMSGLEPTDVSVRVTADGRLELRGKRRGPRQDAMDLLVDEWSVGPYERIVSLPCAVDGRLANVTFGNGVLVIALPKAAQTHAADLSLEPIGHARGQHVGSHGRDVTPTTTAAHRQGQAHGAVG